jgi:hypothetical protein
METSGTREDAPGPKIRTLIPHKSIAVTLSMIVENFLPFAFFHFRFCPEIRITSSEGMNGQQEMVLKTRPRTSKPATSKPNVPVT